MNFKNKVVLITGANRGIGKEIAVQFSQLGATVIGTATTISGRKKIKKKIKNNGKAFILNFKNTKNSKRKIKNICNTFNSIDILVNNAGIIKDQLLINMSQKKWNDVLNVNLNAIFYTSKIVLRKMLKKKFGRIINIGSVIGSIGNIGQTNYSTAKSGLLGFTKSLALEVALKNITVNTISPGIIETNMLKTINKKKRKAIQHTIPMKRFGQPNEIAYVVLFLASDFSSYITGQNIHVNGGIYMN